MEVLSDILRSMRVSGSVYFCDRMDAPWSKTFDEPGAASFHLVRRGECWVTGDDGSVEQLGPGDLVFVEAGREHTLASHAPGAEPTEGACTMLLCGYCRFLTDTGTPLAEVFPALTIVRDEEILRHPWLKTTLDQLSAEYLSQQPGSELVVDKLTEIVIVELIRINFCRAKDSPFIRALNDKQISRALQLLHEKPDQAWTLENLAAEIAMSRAAFAKRFKELVGRPMFEYLTGLRIQRAKEMLRESSLPLYEIASRVGYESDLSFTKTFKKHTGTTPIRYRKEPAVAAG